MADPDWTDPCAVLSWYLPFYYKLKAGLLAVMTQHGDTRAEFKQITPENADAFKLDLESRCAAKQGVKTGRRRAIRFG